MNERMQAGGGNTTVTFGEQRTYFWESFIVAGRHKTGNMEHVDNRHHWQSNSTTNSPSELSTAEPSVREPIISLKQLGISNKALSKIYGKTPRLNELCTPDFIVEHPKGGKYFYDCFSPMTEEKGAALAAISTHLSSKARHGQARRFVINLNQLPDLSPAEVREAVKKAYGDSCTSLNSVQAVSCCKGIRLPLTDFSSNPSQC